MHQKGSPRAHWEDCLFFVCKNQGGNSKDEKVISLKPFQDRLTDIVGYRGVIFNQKGSPMVLWIKGKKRCLMSNLRQTAIVAYRDVVCNQKGYPRVHWILGRLLAKNRDPFY